jgi:adenylate cyclase
MSEKRKLAAILAADVVGFSRPARKKIAPWLGCAHCCDLMDPTISVHNGRVVRLEFRNVRDAVGYAIEVQKGMIERKCRASRQKPCAKAL